MVIWSKDIECYSIVTMDSPKPYFVDVSSDIGSFKAEIEIFELGRLMSGVNKFLFQNILCPWGCTKYIHMAGNLQMYVMIQRSLKKALLAMLNYHEKRQFINSCREYYICDTKYEGWLFNAEEWTPRPSTEFFTGVGKVIITCQNNIGGNKKTISTLQGNPTMFFLMQNAINYVMHVSSLAQ